MKKWTRNDVEAIGKKIAKRSKAADLPTVSANALTKQALRILTMKKFRVWRQNNAGVFDAKKQVYRAGSVTKGISDVIGFHAVTGRFIACEIKAGKDKLSMAQEYFLTTVKDAGGYAFVIRTTDDIENMANQL